MVNNKKKGLLRNPLVSGLVGFLLATLLWRYPFYLIASLVITGMILFAFRDRFDMDDLKAILLGEGNGEESKKSKKKPEEFRICPECGSRTKHKKECSHYGESKR